MYLKGSKDGNNWSTHDMDKSSTMPKEDEDQNETTTNEKSSTSSNFAASENNL